VAGVAFTTQPVVAIEDEFGNTVTTEADSMQIVTAALTTGSGALTGTVTAAAESGVADFAGNGLKINLIGTDKVLTFSVTGSFTDDTTSAFTITFASANKITVSTQPSSSTVAGVAFTTQPVVAIEDEFGNAVTDSSLTVTASLQTGTGNLGGTAGVAAASGVVSYSDLSIDSEGNDKVLRFTQATLANQTADTSPAFTITASTTTSTGGGGCTGFGCDTNTVTTTDLAISMTEIPRTGLVGEELKYTLRVTNNGPLPSITTTLNDTLPVAVSYVSSSASQGSCSGTSSLICQLGYLLSGDSATVSIVVSLETAGTIVSSANVTGNRADSNSANNSATGTTLVREPITVALTYEPSGTLQPGDVIIITATFNREFSGDPNITIDTGTTTLISDNMVATDDPKVRTYTYTIPEDVEGDAKVKITVLDETVTIPATALTNDVISVKSAGSAVALTYEPSGSVQVGDILIITATFDRPVTGAPTIDIDTPGIDLSSADLIDSGDGLVWTYTYTVPADSVGEAVVTISGGTDEDGNTNLKATNNTFTIDSAGPSVAVTYEPSGSVQAGDILVITATFDRPVTGAPTIDIDTPGIDLTSAELIDSGDGLVWTYTYTVPSDSVGEAVVTISGGTDEDGNTNQDAAGNTFNINPSGPKVGLTYQPKGSIKAGDTLIITATFDRPVTGTPTIDIDTPGVDLSSLEMIPSDDGLVWTYIYQVPGDSDGTATVTILGATDESGSPNQPANNNTFKIDSSGPTVTIIYEPDREVKPGETLIITITFSEAVVGPPTITIDTHGVDVPPIALTNSGDGKVWTYVYVVPEDSVGQATVKIEGATDEAGNANQPGANNTFIIESGIGVTTVVYTYDPDRSVRPGETLAITATFSNAVLGTPTVAIDTEGTDLPATVMTPSKKPTVWTFNYEVPENSDGEAEVSIGGVAGSEGDTAIRAINDTFVIARTTIDLSIVVLASPDPVPRLSNITYTITISNNGVENATGVTLTNSLPEETTFISSSAGSATCNLIGGMVKCGLGNLANGDTVSVTIEAAVAADAEGVIVNVAGVAGDQGDPNLANNEAVVQTNVLIGQLAYNLTIKNGNLDATGVTLRDSPDPVFVGLDLTYTLNITNEGKNWITGVTLTVALPTAVKFESVTASLVGAAPPGTIPAILSSFKPGAPDNFSLLARGLENGGGVYLPGKLLGAGGLTLVPVASLAKAAVSSQLTCSESDGTIVCGLGILDADEGAIIIIIVEPLEAGILNNKAEATYEGAAQGTGITKASESTTVIRAVDLSVVKAGNAGTLVPGTTHNYVYIVTNNGPSDASGVALIDALPPLVNFIPSSSNSIDCNENAGIVRCVVDSLLWGKSVNVIIPVYVDPSATGSLTNTVFVVANEADLELSNNTVREIISANRSADLSLSKFYSPELATEDNTIAYTFTVVNNGPSDASGVTITDELPAGVTFNSFTGGSQGCEVIESTVTCQLGSLASKATTTLTMFFSHTTEGTITNNAHVSSAEVDDNPEDDSSTATAEVRFVPEEPETPKATSVPLPTIPPPTPIAQQPSEPSDRGFGWTFRWLIIVIAIGGFVILLGGLGIMFLGRRRRRDQRRRI
jgi:uncharacterized repeat protein (TIGR01451 family)